MSYSNKLRIERLMRDIEQLHATNAELLQALKGVVAVADRKTNEFDAARAAIAKAEAKP